MLFVIFTLSVIVLDASYASTLESALERSRQRR